MKLSVYGQRFLQAEEGFSNRAYQDSRGLWTIGFGNRYWENGREVEKGEVVSVARAEELFRFWVDQFAADILPLIKVPLEQHQFDALVSLAYNIGVRQFSESTLLRKLNSGDLQGAAEQFLAWKRAGNDPDILLLRRKREKELFENVPTVAVQHTRLSRPIRKHGNRG